MVHGIEGFLEDKIVDLAPYLDDEVGKCLFYAGGNDSMDTVKMLSDYAAAHNKPPSFSNERVVRVQIR